MDAVWHTASLDIIINNEQLEKVTNYRYLGLILDATLNWNDHLENAQKSIRQRIGVLKR